MQNVRPHGGAIVVLAAATLIALSASASTDRKLMLTHRSANHRATLADVAEPSARMIAEYEAMSVVTVPESAWERVAMRLVKAGFDVTELDDTIETPRRRIKPAIDRAPQAPFAAGLFILQYAAPATSAWQAAVHQSGVIVVQSLPGRAVLLSASTEQIARLVKLPWVEYVGPYLAEYKYAPLTSPEHTEYTIQIANTTASAAAVEAVRARVGGFLTESRYESELTARIKMKDLASAHALLEEPFVLAVEAYVSPEVSDERQAYSLSGAAVPTGGNYLAWLASRGITPNALTNSGIVVDVADSGVDMGCLNIQRHWDLRGRVVYYTSTGSASDRSDNLGHGTVVAGIVAATLSPESTQSATPLTALRRRTTIHTGNFIMAWGSPLGYASDPPRSRACSPF